MAWRLTTGCDPRRALLGFHHSRLVIGLARLGLASVFGVGPNASCHRVGLIAPTVVHTFSEGHEPLAPAEA